MCTNQRSKKGIGMSKTGYQLVLDLSGPDGNAFAVMGAVRGVLNQIDPGLTKKYLEKSMAGDYDDLLRASCEYVDLVDSSNTYPDILGEVEVVTTVERISTPAEDVTIN